MFSTPDACNLLTSNGLGTLGAVFERAMSGARHAGRAVAETNVTDASGQDHRLFIKLQWSRPRLLPRLSDVLAGEFDQSLPMREWNGLRALGELGLHVPVPLAVFRESGFTLRSAVVLTAVPPDLSLQELMATSAWQELGPAGRERVLDEAADALGRIHRAGLGWKSAKAKHIYPEVHGESCRVWLIDCEGVHRRYTPRIVRRDRATLLKSLRQSNLEPELLARVNGRFSR